MAEDTRTDEQKAKDCNKYLAILKDIRYPFEGMVDNVLTYVNHSRRKVVDKDAMKGQKTGTEVYDGTALRAKNLLVDGMTGYLCSRNLRWFSFMLPGKLNFPRFSGMRSWSGKRMDEYPDIRRWLVNCEEVISYAFTRGNFYDVIPEFIGDGAVPGTAHLLAEEDVGAGRINFTVPHFRECYIAENQYGMVDTNYRVYKLSLRQLADKFGYDVMVQADPNFGPSYENNPYTEKEILHAVYPRKDYDPRRSDSKAKAWASMWVLLSPLKLLNESGYDWMPSITWRWRKNSDEPYGRSPSWDAYVEIKKGDQQAHTNLVAGHKMVEPPMVAEEDLRGLVKTGPGGWTYVSNVDRQMPKQLLQNIQLPYAVDQQERTDKAIREHFHVDFFLMLYQASFNKVELTATQVLGMQGEQAAVLGTRVGQLESEAFNPIIDLVFNIEQRAGRMPEPPPILLDYGNGQIEVDYLGPLAQAQKRLTKTRAIRAGLESVAAVSLVFEAARDVIDGDATMKEALEAAGFPPTCIRPDADVMAIRKMRAKAKAEAAQAEQISQLGKVIPGASKEIQKGSALDLLLGGKREEGTA